jgi:hypothetical protein
VKNINTAEIRKKAARRAKSMVTRLDGSPTEPMHGESQLDFLIRIASWVYEEGYRNGVTDHRRQMKKAL